MKMQLAKSMDDIESLRPTRSTAMADKISPGTSTGQGEMISGL